MRTLIHGARVLVMDEAGTELPRATVTIEDDTIVAVERGAAVPRGAPAPGATGSSRTRTPAVGAESVREIDATGHLLMPGLVNGHFHSSANHLKGSFDSLPLEIFMLFETPADGARDDARSAYVSTLLGAVEMLKSGVTSVLDDAFFVPAPSPAAIDRHLFERWHGAAGGRLRAAVSCSAPQRVTPHYFGELDALSRRHGLPFFVHILETKLQRVLGEEKYGRSLVRYVADLGLLSERMNIIHAVWVDENDMDLIAGSGAVVAHNPISNLRLGSGLMPLRALLDRGIPLCLGSDEAITDDSINMWNVAKRPSAIKPT
jgi:5-methylthioadenosine/S-adenosylhomocysteine deaminase